MAAFALAVPLYQEIARTIQCRVFHGIYPPGAAVPSEALLGSEFGVSRLTVRQALQELRRQGTLVSRRGSGTFVAVGVKLVPPVTFTGYLDDLVLQALTMHTVTVFNGPDPAQGLYASDSPLVDVTADVVRDIFDTRPAKQMPAHASDQRRGPTAGGVAAHRQLLLLEGRSVGPGGHRRRPAVKISPMTAVFRPS